MLSKNWKTWVSTVDFKTCFICKRNNGKIYEIDDYISLFPPVHTKCRCDIVRLKSIYAGEATKDGTSGADWYLKFYKKLPDYYISVEQASAKGWKQILGNLSKVAPNKMIFGGVFRNYEGRLPQKNGRIWYEKSR